MEFEDNFLIFQCVFNEYVNKVAIPKRWEFTKTIKKWPDGTGEGEGISEDGRIWFTIEKRNLLQKVLDYPDLGLFALENYGVVIDHDDKPEGWALSLVKLSKEEALYHCKEARQIFHEYQENRPISEKWDEKELSEDLALDHIQNFYKLSRQQKIELQVYIVYKFAEKVGIPIPPQDKDVCTDIEKAMKDNGWTINQVLKRKQKFSWFCFVHYGMLVAFGKDKNNQETLDMLKIPEKTLDWIDKIADSGQTFAREEIERMWDETKAEADKEQWK